MNYEVHLDIYNGPMELLLDLIKKNKIDIYDIPIAFVADEFVKKMNKSTIDLDLVSDFLLMAATLLEIKSKMLLPKEEVEEEEEDPRLELVQKIVEYQAYKEVAVILKEREFKEAGTFYRKQEEHISEKEIYLLEKIELSELAGTFAKILERVSKEKKLAFESISQEQFPISETIQKIRLQLIERNKFFFYGLLSKQPTKEEVISYFLALLELSKFNEISINISEGQDDLVVERKDLIEYE